MRPSEALALHRTQIREIALRHRVSGVRVFGSVLRGDDVAGSDLDLLVDPTPATTLMDIGAIRFELKPTGSNQRGHQTTPATTLMDKNQRGQKPTGSGLAFCPSLGLVCRNGTPSSH